MREFLAFFDDVLKSLVTDLIATIIIIPAVTYFSLRFFQNFRAARIWAVSTRVRQIFSPRRFPTLVLSTSSVYKGPNNYQRPQTGVGQVRALGVIAKSLSRAYRDDLDDRRLLLSADCNITQGDFTEDLIVIGGPKTNSIGKALLEEELVGVLPAGFSFTTGDYIDEAGKHYAVDQLVAGGRRWAPEHSDEVYGMVLRCKNPRGATHQILTYIGGLGTFGTEASARALIECSELHLPTPLSWRWWRTCFSRKRFGFLAIVQASLTGNAAEGSTRSVVSPRIVHYEKIVWQKLQIND